MELCDFEINVLRICGGENIEGMHWGAAMSVALESLVGSGLAEKTFGPDGIDFKITQAGIKFLNNIERNQR